RRRGCRWRPAGGQPAHHHPHPATRDRHELFRALSGQIELPTPDLNPIEFIWKSIKRVISLNSIPSLGDLKRCITRSWDELAIRHSFAKHWIEQFVTSIVTYRCS
ncbi:MAG: hypothetical protein AADX96_06620, partial [Thiocapsa sp. C3-sup]